MSYLIRTKNKKLKSPLTKYIGAFMPLRIYTAICISSLAQNTNKTTVMERVFEEWMTITFYALEKVYYKQIAENMNTRFEELRLSRRSLTYSIFCEDLRKELESKGLHYTNIQNIITELNDLHYTK